MRIIVFLEVGRRVLYMLECKVVIERFADEVCFTDSASSVNGAELRFFAFD